MGRTKTQKETRDFSMTLIIKTHQNNNKIHINFFGWDRDLSIHFGGGGTGIIFIFFYSFKKLFEEMGGEPWPQLFSPSSVSRRTFFFFFYMSAQERGGGIRTSDLHFIRRGPNRLS
jgi:hypothetical protein